MSVLDEIGQERARQDAKWGQQNHPDGTGRDGDTEMALLDRAKCKANVPDDDNWRDILQEEVSEAFAELDPVLLRAELIQVAAVAVAWVEHIDRRRTSPAVLLGYTPDQRATDLPGRVGKGAPPHGDPAAPHTTAT